MRGISLLEELHVLSQTQTLLLESGNLEGLTTIVESKKAVVDRIVEAERDLASLRSATAPGSTIQHHIELKERAVHLIERISAVEQRNQVHLEALRSDIIQRSRSLQEKRKLLEVYRTE